jgi:hypothetical protein
MTDERKTVLEDESCAAKDARRRRWRRRHLEELAVAAVFLASIFIADHFSAGGVSAPAFAFVAIAIGSLAFWFMLYFRRHQSLDEFERATDLKAHAIAGGAVVLIATAWGVAETILSAPDFPIVLLAPLFSGFFLVARFRILSAMR